MAEKGKPPEEEGGEGAPLWIISFADMISLLMAFFVMLTTFSSFGPRESEKIRTVARLVLMPNYGWHKQLPQSALQPTLVAAGDGQTGSERPTLENTPNGKSMKETHTPDYKRAKVFVIESSKMFWGQGQTISAEGGHLLDTMAAFFNKMPGQIVICERGPVDNAELSITRSVAVICRLANKGISKDRFNISAKTMIEGGNAPKEQQLEIVLTDELESK